MDAAAGETADGFDGDIELDGIARGVHGGGVGVVVSAVEGKRLAKQVILGGHLYFDLRSRNFFHISR